jgi:ribonucleoside-diphosphate reductase alpha chain
MREEMTHYEDVKNLTTEEYFGGNQFSIDAFNRKYSLFEGETYVQAVKRVCDYIASAEETEEKRQYWSARWFDEIFNDWWHPAGSIMQGAAAGRKISMANCTTISMGAISEQEEWDNLESIIRNVAYTVAKTAAYRQGLGVDFSRLRPAGTRVLNSANQSTGAVHWMKFIDSIGYYVGQKGRIPAMLFSISCSHPDVIDFITAKSDYTKIQNANISVQCTDAFYEAVDKDEDWKLTFDVPAVKKGDRVYLDVHSIDKDCFYEQDNNKYYRIARHDRPAEHIEKVVRARELLELIARCMYKYAEPGVQNIDVARRFSNSDYVYDANDEYDSRIISTNACSEQYLSRESLCVLASCNAGRFSTNPEDYERECGKIAESMNRFLDNVNEMELRNHTFATPFQRLAIQKLRRTGAGVTNLGGWLFKRNLEYGSKEGNQAVGHLFQRFNYYLYKSSINLGMEKGSFELFNRQKYEQSPFVQEMMKLGLVFTAMRNCTCSSVAPTGTLSLMFREYLMSYGVEPSFGLYYWKRTRMTGKYEYYFCVPQVVIDAFRNAGYPIPIASNTIKDTWDGKLGKPVAAFIDAHMDKIGIRFKRAPEVSPFDKLDLMAEMMKSVDSSISVTYMLPENADWKSVYDFIILAHKRGVKSIAAFPDRKMYGIVSSTPFRDLAVKLRRENVEIHNQNFTVEELKELDDELKTRSSTTGTIDGTAKNALKRPKTLPCDIHHVKVIKKLDKPRSFEYLVVVGLINGNKPYEVFAMENGTLDKSYTKGEVIKVNRGRYDLVLEDGRKYENIASNTTEYEDAVTRLASCSLRHDVPINFIVEQLEKVDGDLMCFAKGMAKALKKYIKDGTKVTGQICPVCGKEDLIRLEGCITCSFCNWSKCG